MEVGYSFWDKNLMAYTLIKVLIGLIISFHCIDLAMHEPLQLKSKDKYTYTKYYFHLFVPIIFIILSYIYFFVIAKNNKFVIT